MVLAPPTPAQVPGPHTPKAVKTHACRVHATCGIPKDGSQEGETCSTQKSTLREGDTCRMAWSDAWGGLGMRIFNGKLGYNINHRYYDILIMIKLYHTV